MMNTKTGEIGITQAAEKDHAGLAAAVMPMLKIKPVGQQPQPIMLCNAAELCSVARGTIAVALDRSGEPSLVRNAPGKFTLSYDPTECASAAAALIAIAAEPGMPVCADPGSSAMMALAQRVARSDIPVLIEGPTGTGKEVLSRYIHAASARADGPFIAINCAAMPETMLEALLFGHRKGAYTGATEASEGFFRAADGGTLLLDEIGELPLALQSKLLRTLQEGEVVPLGQAKPVKINVRIIACTNRILPDEVAEGRFRADLYYRLNVFPLQMGALRTRPGDIGPLAFAMMLRHSAIAGPAEAKLPWIGAAALLKLAMHSWPGNVRELENVLRRALLLSDGRNEIGAEDIEFDRPVRPVTQTANPLGGLQQSGNNADNTVRRTARLSDIARQSEAQAILETLDECSGNRGKTAKTLGISERTLRYRMADMREAGILTARAAR